MLLWSGTIKVRPEHLKTANIPSTEWEQAQAITERLNKVHELEPESSVIAVIQDISRRPVRELSSTEEKILGIAEAKNSVEEMAVSLIQNAMEAEAIIRAIASIYPDVMQKVLSSEKRF